MSANNDTIQKTITVTVLLCLVCAVVVAGAAVFLKPLQEKNKLLAKQESILKIAAIPFEPKAVSETFQTVTQKVVDLRSGKFTDEVSAANYDQRSAAKNPSMSQPLSGAEDIASIKRRADFATVYLVEKDGQVEKVILPVHGYGLWSTMYGFLALEGDTKTVVGFGFYDQGETPGLGGEVDNPRWTGIWPGKKVFDENFSVKLEFPKTGADRNSPNYDHQIDGLAGATLTTRGVENLVKFWLGESGFGPFLANLRAGEA
ncbi:Na(+)-translocating NADH-quinone reductase subunit C [Aestuariirhabdus litorea]|uniref:Na(+)-translocating NADH-quinone reductase subunit C n=1 Tax=Aestuariirhabdus litorea TaxID=2528527 RepID=A0A3P3VPX6_9GAMM|nr:Na(+)-translocating NADH-quinone reductase subunit C [Aestuariirhabdus litorea]RRJ84670.1 Na(+)-translocating NADH-quinone reductase subunit C [Aestuariirhabdus litorea]RWW97894.1 Na(+)-translocating NADH-quinone reductase subunit C [Endozoicomonadaceae bacterium GTF-13]